MKNEYKHPLDVINEHLMNGYYKNMPPFSYNKDVAFVKYMLGYCSKVDYEIAKTKCEMYNYKTALCKYIL